MSMLMAIECDGPSCGSRVKQHHNPMMDGVSRVLTVPADWLAVSQTNVYPLHFCSFACLKEWLDDGAWRLQVKDSAA